MQLIDLVRQTIRRHDLASRGTRVAVAVSGGPDSVALAHLVRELDRAGELRAAGIAHFNHQLRAAADRDERFSVALAESLGWPIVTDREDVAARARRERRSIEDAARAARYEFFERARTELAADALALGHTRDDQAETFLLRLLRGAGPRGLSAMHPRNGFIIRPLLDCRRRSLGAYLDERGIASVEDESNRDVSVPRNRVRAELVPLLEARFNAGIVDVLAGEAELARDEWTWMEAAADQLLASLTSHVSSLPGLETSDSRRATSDLKRETSGVVIALDVEPLSAAPLALRRLAVWRAMTRAAGGRPVSFEHVQAALRLLQPSAAASAGVDAPGHRVQRMGARIVLTGRPPGAVGRPAAEAVNLFRYPLSIPGEVRLAEAGCVVSAETQPEGLAPEAGPAAPGQGAVAIVRSDVCRGPFAVRNRRPGDRFRPIGLGGEKKLQDFFVDRKVARQRRDAVPLVVDGADRIVWVAGYAIDEEFRVTDPTQAVVILRLTQV